MRHVFHIRSASTTAVLFAAAVAVSACGSGTAGNSTPGRDTGSPKALSAPKYVDVTGQGQVTVDDRGQQFAVAPTPGVLISHRTTATTSSDGTSGCTLGPAVTVGNRPAFLTAGHCSDSGASQYASTGPGPTDVRELGPAVQAVSEQASGVDGVLDDRALIFTKDAAGSSMMARTWPIAGSLPLERTRELPTGTPICVNAARSRIRCGGLISATGDRLRFEVVTEEGDSGAPVFVVDGHGRATVVALLLGGNDATSTSTFIEPTLRAFNATLLTAP